MSQVANLRLEIQDYGKAKPGEIVAVSERVLKSTVFIEPGATLSSVRFFTGREVLDGFWNNHRFPLTETCMDVRAISLVHNLAFATTPANLIASKAQQVFEDTSWLRVKYRQRSNRIEVNSRILTESTILSDGNVARQHHKGLSVHEFGGYSVPNMLQIGGQQDIEWLLDIPSGFTVPALITTGPEATPVLPGSTLPSNQGYFISLELLVTERGESAI